MKIQKLFDEETEAMIGVTSAVAPDGSLCVSVSPDALKRLSVLHGVTAETAREERFEEPRKVFMAMVSQFAMAVGLHADTPDAEVMAAVTCAFTFMYPRVGVIPSPSKVEDDAKIDGLIRDVRQAVRDCTDNLRQEMIAAGMPEAPVEPPTAERAIFIAAVGRPETKALFARVADLSDDDRVMTFAVLPPFADSARQGPRAMADILIAVTKSMSSLARISPAQALDCVARVGAELTVEVARDDKTEAIEAFARTVTRIGKVMINADKAVAGHC